MNDSAAVKEEVGWGAAQREFGARVCVCVKNIYVCSWECGRGGVRGSESTGCHGSQPMLSKIIYSTPGFPCSLPKATLSWAPPGLGEWGCVWSKIGVCVWGVLLCSLGSLPTTPWGKKVAGPGRHTPVTSNALLTPVSKKGQSTTFSFHHQQTSCYNASVYNMYSMKTNGGRYTAVFLVFYPFQSAVLVQLWQQQKKIPTFPKQSRINFFRWTEICYSSFLMSCLSS